MARSEALAHSISSDGNEVVLRHRAANAACACLTLDAAAAAAYCTPEDAAQIRLADGFLQNQCQNSRVFLQKVFLTWFSTLVDSQFLTEKYFTTIMYYHWLRSAVEERRLFPGELFVDKPSAVGRPTRPTQPFILSGSIH